MTVEQHSLFDADATESIRETPTSPTVRLTARNLALLAAGRHPISGHKVHEDAPPVNDRKAPGPRCGSCYFAVRALHADVIKCGVDQGSHITHGAATDLRLWYPACTEFVADTPLTHRSDEW